MTDKPRIGITMPVKGGRTQNLAIRLGVWLTGGEGVTVTPQTYSNEFRFDGLIVSGGTDVHPSLYKSSEIKELYKYDEPRDKMESLLIRSALEKDLPMLCICRGAQLLNIISGGSLHSDVSKSFKNANYSNSLWAKIFFRKKININEKSKIFEILQKKDLMVNSMHSQAVDKVGECVLESSKEDNGVVQSIERQDKKFALGVQFHPEFLSFRPEIRGLFKCLIDNAKSYKEERNEKK